MQKSRVQFPPSPPHKLKSKTRTCFQKGSLSGSCNLNYNSCTGQSSGIYCRFICSDITRLDFFYTPVLAEFTFRNNSDKPKSNQYSSIPGLPILRSYRFILLLYPSAARKADIHAVLVYVSFRSWRTLTLWNLILHMLSKSSNLLRLSMMYDG